MSRIFEMLVLIAVLAVVSMFIVNAQDIRYVQGVCFGFPAINDSIKFYALVDDNDTTAMVNFISDKIISNETTILNKGDKVYLESLGGFFGSQSEVRYPGAIQDYWVDSSFLKDTPPS